MTCCLLTGELSPRAICFDLHRSRLVKQIISPCHLHLPAHFICHIASTSIQNLPTCYVYQSVLFRFVSGRNYDGITLNGKWLNALCFVAGALAVCSCIGSGVKSLALPLRSQEEG